ncbi:MAG: tripartite tricarboxylate transporter substrate binding protein [Betaproteobacteria bacterium]|nr:tripartite tricarboxylate transporter substrate binding protein [Betaproteobacteria bacterium]
MLMRRFAVWVPVGILILGADAVSARNFPNRPVRIVTAEVGGTSDFMVRLIGQGLTSSWGQPVVVENRAAGGGIVAASTVAKATPDGYTLLSYGHIIWLLPFLRKNLPYDPVRDLSPVTWTTSTPNVLVVHPSLPVRSVADLIALAKARPGELNYGSGATGATSHLGVELFKAMAGVSIVRINYRGTGQAVNDLISGQIHVMFSSVAAAVPHVDAGRLRPLAITSRRPSALFPGLPAVAATVPGYESIAVFGIFAPAGTPPALISRLNHEIVQVLGRTDVKEKLLKGGVEPIGNPPEEFAVKLKSEMSKWAKVIKDVGITPED